MGVGPSKERHLKPPLGKGEKKPRKKQKDLTE